MNLIDKFRDILDLLDKKFENSKIRPAWETISSFFFSQRNVTKITGPHLRDFTDLKRYMSVVMAAVVPTVIASIYLFGWRCLAIVILSYTVGIIVELGFAIMKNEEVTEGMFVTCILYPMILPPTIPYWMATIGIIFGIVIGKEIFGGTGKNIFNPAIVARTFLVVTFPVDMAAKWVAPFNGWPGGFAHWTQKFDTISAATPLGSFKNGNPAEIMDLLLGTHAGAMGETCTLIIIISGVLLMITKVSNWRLPVATIAGALLLAFFMNQLDPVKFASPLYHLLSGGLLFGAFYMVTDPVSAPFTSIGKWIYAFLIGIITIMIRNLSGFPEGMMFSILLMNIFAPVIDDAVLGIKYRKERQL